MNHTNKIILAVIFLSTIFIANASKEITAESTSAILKRIATEVGPSQTLKNFLQIDSIKCATLLKNVQKDEQTFLAQILENRSVHQTPNFGLACKLSPLMKRQPSQGLLFIFGNSLLGLHYDHPNLAMQGIKYIKQSNFLDVTFFDDINTIRSFKEYCEYEQTKNPFAFYQGDICFFKNGKVIAPTRKNWQNFITNILNCIQFSPYTLFNLFEIYDLEAIKNLVKKYKLTFEIEDNSLNVSYNVYYFGNVKKKSINFNKGKTPNRWGISIELNIVINFLQDALIRCKDAWHVLQIIKDLMHE